MKTDPDPDLDGAWLELACAASAARIQALQKRLRVMRMFFRNSQLRLTYPHGPERPPVFTIEIRS